MGKKIQPLNDKKNLRFVIALKIEAISFIKLYNLSKFNSSKSIFEIYNNLELNIWLVISGVGNINSAAATIYLYDISMKTLKNIWINFGMAGCKNYEIGAVYNINKVTYNSGNRVESYYTSALINNKLKSKELISVEKPEINFLNTQTLYDMEAYGFIKTAERICTRELICITKIISDNQYEKPRNFIDNINVYLELKLSEIKELINSYIEISKKINNVAKSSLRLVEKKFHLTFYNKNVISDLVSRIEIIYSKKELENIIREADTLESLIYNLRKKVKNFKMIIK